MCICCRDNLVRAPFQSDKIHVRALIVGDYIDDKSHWTAEKTLSQWLKEEKIPAISGQGCVVIAINEQI